MLQALTKGDMQPPKTKHTPIFKRRLITVDKSPYSIKLTQSFDYKTSSFVLFSLTCLSSISLITGSSSFSFS